MEKKLSNLLKNKISERFAAELEDKLMDQYQPKQSNYVFWRYSLPAFSLIVLIVFSIFFLNPFTSEKSIVANALEYYKTLEEAPGIFYAKYKVTITGQDGVETEFGNEYVEEVWTGDKGEYLQKIDGKIQATMLLTSDGRYFSNSPFEQQIPVIIFSCIVDEQRQNGFIGDTILDIQSEDYSVYTVYRNIMEEPSSESLDQPDGLPEYEWISNGKIPQEALSEIEKNSQYQIETVIIDGNEILKITAESNGEARETYFEKDSLTLKKFIFYPTDFPDYKTTVDYFEIKNITDLSADELFSPDNYEIAEIFMNNPDIMNKPGCYLLGGNMMTDDEMSQLLDEIPASAKEEIQASKERVTEMLKTEEVHGVR